MVVFWFLEHVNSLSCNWYEHTANNLERSLFSGSNDTNQNIWKYIKFKTSSFNLISGNES